jgi:hypothetical protein
MSQMGPDAWVHWHGSYTVTESLHGITQVSACFVCHAVCPAVSMASLQLVQMNVGEQSLDHLFYRVCAQHAVVKYAGLLLCDHCHA